MSYQCTKQNEVIVEELKKMLAEKENRVTEVKQFIDEGAVWRKHTEREINNLPAQKSKGENTTKGVKESIDEMQDTLHKTRKTIYDKLSLMQDCVNRLQKFIYESV